MRRRNQRGPMLSTGQPLADGFSLACGSAERRPTVENVRRTH
jgi:hypothetical protein